jgi:hypothetical protein
MGRLYRPAAESHPLAIGSFVDNPPREILHLASVRVPVNLDGFRPAPSVDDDDTGTAVDVRPERMAYLEAPLAAQDREVIHCR